MCNLNRDHTCDFMGLWGVLSPWAQDLDKAGITAESMRYPKESQSIRYCGCSQEVRHKMSLHIEKFIKHLNFQGVLTLWMELQRAEKRIISIL